MHEDEQRLLQGNWHWVKSVRVWHPKVACANDASFERVFSCLDCTMPRHGFLSGSEQDEACCSRNPSCSPECPSNAASHTMHGHKIHEVGNVPPNGSEVCVTREFFPSVAGNQDADATKCFKRLASELLTGIYANYHVVGDSNNRLLNSGTITMPALCIAGCAT